MHPGLEQCLLFHATKQPENVGLTRLKTVAGTPRQNDDLGLVEGGLDGGIVELANLMRQAFKSIRLDVSELVDHDQAAHPFKFWKSFLEDDFLQELY